MTEEIEDEHKLRPGMTLHGLQPEIPVRPDDLKLDDSDGSVYSDDTNNSESSETNNSRPNTALGSDIESSASNELDDESGFGNEVYKRSEISDSSNGSAEQAAKLERRSGEKELHAAATTIASNFKGYKVRKELSLKRDAATVIAANFKSYKAQKVLRQKRSAATTIATNFKGYRARKELQQKKKAATTIATNFKGYRARKKFQEQRAAVNTIADNFRAYQTRKAAMNRPSSTSQSEVNEQIKVRPCSSTDINSPEQKLCGAEVTEDRLSSNTLFHQQKLSTVDKDSVNKTEESKAN